MGREVTILGKPYPAYTDTAWIHTQGSLNDPPFGLRQISFAEFNKAWMFVPDALEEQRFFLPWDHDQGMVTVHMAWWGNAGVGWYASQENYRAAPEFSCVAFGCRHHFVPDDATPQSPTWVSLVCDKCGQKQTIDSSG